jgi:hypothetical protein
MRLPRNNQDDVASIGNGLSVHGVEEELTMGDRPWIDHEGVPVPASSHAEPEPNIGVSRHHLKVNLMTTKTDDLREIIDQKLTSLFREMEDAGWSASDVALVMSDVIKTRWLDQIEKLRSAREAGQDNFVSDGNEG